MHQRTIATVDSFWPNLSEFLNHAGTFTALKLSRLGDHRFGRRRASGVRKEGIVNGVGTLPAEAAFAKFPRPQGLWTTMLAWLHDRGVDRLVQQLRESEEQMNLAAEAAHLGTWIWDVRANYVWLSPQCRQLFGLCEKRDVAWEAFLDCVHPEDRAATDLAMRNAIDRKAPYRATVNFRLLLPDGTVRYIEARGRMGRDGNGSPIRMLGVCIDVSERWRVEEAARELSGRFITAQEDERRRIARELHDDLNQRLALLSVEMELFGRTPASGQKESDERLHQLASRVREISSEVHKLSYELHPAKLDQLGLLAAARAFCRESSQRCEIQFVFSHNSVPRNLPSDIALCLYRVLQESLQNVIRHSGAKKAQVELSVEGKSIQLVITDSGRGFDVDHARRNGGLGLVSMEERVRLVHGTIIVRSKPFGTRVEVNIPLP